MNYYIAPSPCGSVRMRSKWLTDNTDATDFIFSRIFIVLLDFSAPVGRWDCHGLSLYELLGFQPVVYKGNFIRQD